MKLHFGKCKFELKLTFLKYNFVFVEVGGPNKTYDQIKNIPQSYLAVDGIEYGFGNRIPLWMFGILY